MVAEKRHVVRKHEGMHSGPYMHRMPATCLEVNRGLVFMYIGKSKGAFKQAGVNYFLPYED